MLTAAAGGKHSLALLVMPFAQVLPSSTPWLS